MSKHSNNTIQNSDPSSSSDASDASEDSSILDEPNIKTSINRKPGDKLNSATTKKKKRRKPASICLTNCRYEIVRKVAQRFNLKEVGDAENWNLYWTDMSISIERCKDMKRFQRINHFPGMLEICRKDLLARNLNRMAKSFPKDYNFFPKTWCFPADLGDALNYSRVRKNKTFILKPDMGCQGRGIFITKSLKEVKPTERMICQVYISRPFLIEGYKFDLRVYVLLTSCRPLRVYVYNEGLVRFATNPYQEPTNSNCSNVFMHLTNYAVNKHNSSYKAGADSGSKRKLSWFNNYMRTVGHDVGRLWQRIDDIIIKTIFSALPVLQHSYQACFPNHNLVPACCELLGMDILLDRHLAPQLLEVNHSPSFHTDTPLDAQVKSNLLTDMFAMMNLERCDKRKVMREERRRIQERLTRPHSKESDHTQAAALARKPSFSEYHRHEVEHRGGFRLVYPDPRTSHTYNKFMKQVAASLYADTACSNARHQAAVAIRDDLIAKAKEEAAKRVPPIPVRPPVETAHKPYLGQSMSGKQTKGSFIAEPIDQAEEKERLESMAHRDFLVKSYGLADHIFLLLKQNGALRPADEKKYHQGKQGRHSIHSAIKDLPSDKRQFIIQDFMDFSAMKAMTLGNDKIQNPYRAEKIRWSETMNCIPRSALSNTSKYSSYSEKKHQVT